MSIEPGSVVHWKSGRYFVAEVYRRSVAICPIDLDPIPRHRADVEVSEIDALFLGLLTGSCVRCIPFAVRLSKVTKAGPGVTPGLLTKVRAGIDREVSIRAFEDGNAPI